VFGASGSVTAFIGDPHSFSSYPLIILHVETVTADANNLIFSFSGGVITSCNYDRVSSAAGSEEIRCVAEMGTRTGHKTSLYSFTAIPYLDVETAPSM
jgi:hypothetical protein